MDVIVIQILAFTSMLMLVIGINHLVRGEKRAADTSSKPALFKAFSNEIATVGQLIGPAIDRASPLQAVQIRKDLIAANLPMEINEIRGMQGLACVSLGLVAGIGVFLYNMNWSHALIAMVFFALLVFLGVWIVLEGRRGWGWTAVGIGAAGLSLAKPVAGVPFLVAAGLLAGCLDREASWRQRS
jgi:hypothetical protein